MPELLRPTVDFVFKRIFGDERNKDVLVDFLNSIFESAHRPLIESVEILNPFIDKEALTDKMSVLDIRARTESKTLVNVEIQLLNAGDMPKRTLFYWSRLYTEQLEEGDPYRSLQRTIAVNILDTSIIENAQYHNIYHVREDTTGEWLTDALEIHFLELRKLRESAQGITRRLVRWMLFLSARTKEQMNDLAREEPMMAKALTTLEFLSQDDQARHLYEARQKALHDYASAVEYAKEQGIQQKALEIARAMLAKRLDIKTIEEITQLPITTIEMLRSEGH